MKFKVDENLPVEVRQILAEAGYDALTVLDQRLGGTSDSDLIRICQTEQRVLISLDTDFADIRANTTPLFVGWLLSCYNILSNTAWRQWLWKR